MQLLIPILVLLCAPAAMFGVRSVRNGFATQWLIAVTSLVGVLVYLGYLRGQLPIEAQIAVWQPETLFPVTPMLLLDSISWPFAMVVLIIAIAVLVTGVVRLVLGIWLPWAGTLALGAISLLAVLAGDPLMLLFAWASLDLVDLMIEFIQESSESSWEQAVIGLAARISGMAFLIWAMLSAKSQGITLSFTFIPSNISLFLLLAAGLRLGVIPLQAPLLSQAPVRQGLGTSLRLLPMASSLVLLSRAATVGVPQPMVLFLLIITAVAASYSALSWLLAKNVLEARPFWILSMAALAVSAAIKGDFQACQSWGLALLLGGSFIFLLTPNHQRLLPLGILGLLSLSALPFSLTWNGLGIYTLSGDGLTAVANGLVNGVLFLSHTFILLGFIKFAVQIPAEKPALERWMWLIYPVGLVMIILTALLTGWDQLPELRQLSWVDWAAGLSTLAAAVVVWRWGRVFADVIPGQSAFRRSSDWSTTFWAYLLSMKWLYRFANLIYRMMGRILDGFTHALEGDGGLLWAFVLLGLIWSLFLG